MGKGTWPTRKSLDDLRVRRVESVSVTLSRYRGDAGARNKTWELTDELFESLIQSPCFYCGALPSESDGGHNGIDRVDNGRGYETDNVVPCCGKCNMMKRNLSREVFVEHAIRIARHMGGVNGESPVELYRQDEDKKRRLADETTDRYIRLLYARQGRDYLSDEELMGKYD
jgi:hypothetical protein